MPRYAKITKSKRELEDLLNYQKSKTKWYMDENKELKAAQKKHDDVIAKRDERIVELETEVVGLKGMHKIWSHRAKRARYKSRQRTKVVQAERDDMRLYKTEVVAQVSHLTKDYDWDKDVSRVQVVEVIMRTIVTYTQLLREETITFSEFAYLLVGSQMEAFRMQDVIDRVGFISKTYKKDFKMLIDEGMITKVYRKQAFYLTPYGKDRLNDILRYIYENKIGTYRILKKVFNIGEE